MVGIFLASNSLTMVASCVLFVLTLAWILLTRKKYERSRIYYEKRRIIPHEDGGLYDNVEFNHKLQLLAEKLIRLESMYKDYTEEQKTVILGKLRARVMYMHKIANTLSDGKK